MVRVYAPASSANMSVGFDVLGAAVTPVDGSLLGDVVSVEAADHFSLNNLGRFANKLPPEPSTSAGSDSVRSWVKAFRWR